MKIASAWFMLPFMRVFVWFVFLLLGPFKVKGRNRVPMKGGVLIIANHIADIDPIAVQYSSPRHVRFMAKSELFSMKVLGPLLRWFGAFPVRRGAPDRVALKQAIQLLKANEAVCIFPEGRLSKDGNLQPLLPGAMLIAKQAECPIICCLLTNTNKILPYGKLIPKPSFRRTVTIWGDLKTFEKSSSMEEILEWSESELRRLATVLAPSS